MKKLLIIIFALLFIGCKSGERLMLADAHSDHSTENDHIIVKKGDLFEIHFISNESLGTCWQYVNKQEVTIVDSIDQRSVSRAPAGIVGAASNLYIKFKAVNKGTDTLIFKYFRVFDEDFPVTVEKKIITVK